MSSRSRTDLFQVDPLLAGKTLASVLRHWIGNLSWKEAERLVRSRRVSVNGTVCVDGGRRLKAGDVLHQHQHARSQQPTAKDVKILFLDSHVVVVSKPALMTTLRHREERFWKEKRKNFQPTLDECLAKILSERWNGRTTNRNCKLSPGRKTKTPAKPIRHSRPRIRPVHRLDRDTSGVMVFALTPQAETNLIRQFKRHSIERCYHAIVAGHPKDQRIESRLVRDRGDGLRGSTKNPQEGEKAITHVRVVERLREFSLVECRLETGRTHQIRIHLSELGHAVCGDPIYKVATGTEPKDSGAPRLALHAFLLGFDHPISGKRMEFTAPLPADLSRFLNGLRNSINAKSLGNGQR